MCIRDRTEAVHLELKKLLQDLNLVMEDGSWIHFEFQSKNEGLEGLKRFHVYEAVTSYQYKVKITTYVSVSYTHLCFFENWKFHCQK